MVIVCLIRIFIFLIKNSEKTKTDLLTFFLLSGLLMIPMMDYYNYNKTIIKQNDFNKKIKEITERIENRIKEKQLKDK